MRRQICGLRWRRSGRGIRYCMELYFRMVRVLGGEIGGSEGGRTPGPTPGVYITLVDNDSCI